VQLIFIPCRNIERLPKTADAAGAAFPSDALLDTLHGVANGAAPQ